MLIQHVAYIDRSDYFINEVDKILGILVSILQPESVRVSVRFGML